jgi:hypothetical protein
VQIGERGKQRLAQLSPDTELAPAWLAHHVHRPSVAKKDWVRIARTR